MRMPRPPLDVVCVPGFNPCDAVEQSLSHVLSGDDPAAGKVVVAVGEGLEPVSGRAEGMGGLGHRRTIGALRRLFQPKAMRPDLERAGRSSAYDNTTPALRGGSRS